ncbi:zf-HC2 domain-containing protein [Micromonospora gifhornensis]
MSTNSSHPADEHVDIGGYLMQTLDAEQVRQIEEHLTGCAECRDEVESLREYEMALEAVPDAMLLEGPPEGGDLLLQRTLRQIRSESREQRQRRTSLIAVAAAAAVAASVSAGVMVGRSADGAAAQVAAGPTPAVSATPAAPGTRFATALDPDTGVRMTVAVAPSEGWVRVNAAVLGIPAGERCRLIVVGRDGSTILAGSWLVSAKGETEGVSLDGSALIAPSEVVAVRVENTDGKTYADVAL